MTECEYLEGCPFFNDKMSIEKGLGKLYKERYCLNTYTECARYKVKKKLGGDKVPTNLYPNMHEKAQKLISEMNY